MTVVAKDRKDDSVPKTIEAISENKDQQWVIKDNLNMKNFHELVQDPALEYDFTLDDFQKRAIYRLEQG
jgi:superfamily II RNA helicase